MHLQNIVFETDFCKLISNNVRRWRGLSGYYGIQYPNNDIKFGSHGSLGRNSDGTTSLLKFAENRGRFALGYEPKNADKRRIPLGKKRKKFSSFTRARTMGGEGPYLPHQRELCKRRVDA